MEDAGFDFEIQLAGVPEGIGAPVMEKRASTMTDFGHDIGVGRRRVGRGTKISRVDPVFLARLQNGIAQGVLAYQPGGAKRERRAELSQVDQHI